MSARARRSVRAVAFAVAILAAAGCAGPARTDTAYRLKARTTARSALSVLATSDLVARIVDKNHAFPTYVSVALDDAERDLDGTQSTFASIQPPDANSDQLRDDLTTALDDAASTVSAMRISARRNATSDLLQAASEIPKRQAELERFESLSA